MSSKPAVGVRSEVSDPILKRVHLSTEFGLPVVALLSLLLVDAILSAQSLFLETPVRILRGKVVDCHPSGFCLRRRKCLQPLQIESIMLLTTDEVNNTSLLTDRLLDNHEVPQYLNPW